MGGSIESPAKERRGRNPHQYDVLHGLWIRLYSVSIAERSDIGGGGGVEKIGFSAAAAAAAIGNGAVVSYWLRTPPEL